MQRQKLLTEGTEKAPRALSEKVVFVPPINAGTIRQ